MSLVAIFASLRNAVSSLDGPCNVHETVESGQVRRHADISIRKRGCGAHYSARARRAYIRHRMVCSRACVITQV